MISNCDLRLATANDARDIALMSRDLVEQGLGWRWTEAKILGCIRDPNTNVAVAYERGILVGFGIMKYADQEAHLNLLAVTPPGNTTASVPRSWRGWKLAHSPPASAPSIWKRGRKMPRRAASTASSATGKSCSHADTIGAGKMQCA